MEGPPYQLNWTRAKIESLEGDQRRDVCSSVAPQDEVLAGDV
jgi:hypothetical protein